MDIPPPPPPPLPVMSKSQGITNLPSPIVGRAFPVIDLSQVPPPPPPPPGGIPPPLPPRSTAKANPAARGPNFLDQLKASSLFQQGKEGREGIEIERREVSTHTSDHIKEVSEHLTLKEGAGIESWMSRQGLSDAYEVTKLLLGEARLEEMSDLPKALAQLPDFPPAASQLWRALLSAQEVGLKRTAVQLYLKLPIPKNSEQFADYWSLLVSLKDAEDSLELWSLPKAAAKVFEEVPGHREYVIDFWAQLSKEEQGYAKQSALHQLCMCLRLEAPWNAQAYALLQEVCMRPHESKDLTQFMLSLDTCLSNKPAEDLKSQVFHLFSLLGAENQGTIRASLSYTFARYLEDEANALGSSFYLIQACSLMRTWLKESAGPGLIEAIKSIFYLGNKKFPYENQNPQEQAKQLSKKLTQKINELCAQLFDSPETLAHYTQGAYTEASGILLAQSLSAWTQSKSADLTKHHKAYFDCLDAFISEGALALNQVVFDTLYTLTQAVPSEHYLAHYLRSEACRRMEAIAFFCAGEASFTESARACLKLNPEESITKAIQSIQKASSQDMKTKMKAVQTRTKEVKPPSPPPTPEPEDPNS